MPQVNKKVIQSGGSKPIEHERVCCCVSLTIEQNTVLENQTVTFDLGHCEDFGVLKILDEVVQTMGLNEICCVELTVSEGLSSDELKLLGSTASPTDKMVLTVYLRDIQKLADFWEMSESDKIAVAEVMKRRGNKLFKNQQYSRAFRTYKTGIKYLRGSVSVLSSTGTDATNTSTFRPEASRLLVFCYSNASLCLLHLSYLYRPKDADGQKQPSEQAKKLLRLCIKYCRSATCLDPNYAKSWFRLAKAHAELGEFDEAINAGEQCLRVLDPSSASAKAELAKHLSCWRDALSSVENSNKQRVRQAILKAYENDDNWSDEDEIEKFPISIWSNSLADNMMSLHEELEAFGEKMPERKASRTNRRLETIVDEDDQCGE